MFLPGDILGDQTVCDDQLNGDSLCSDDYIHKTVYQDEETVLDQLTYHFFTDNTFGNTSLSMAYHDMWLSVETGLPVQYSANFHPFGKW